MLGVRIHSQKERIPGINRTFSREKITFYMQKRSILDGISISFARKRGSKDCRNGSGKCVAVLSEAQAEGVTVRRGKRGSGRWRRG